MHQKTMVMNTPTLALLLAALSSLLTIYPKPSHNRCIFR
uniref:Uncharacterized protein n=1 Tax=Rhizophora mucronata TaxID=61149 RepID=A0A2P2QHS7_RHIMU